MWFIHSFIGDSGTIFHKEDFHYKILKPKSPTAIFGACSSWAWSRILSLSKPEQRRYWDHLNLSDIAKLENIFQASCQRLEEASMLFPIDCGCCLCFSCSIIFTLKGSNNLQILVALYDPSLALCSYWLEPCMITALKSCCSALWWKTQRVSIFISDHSCLQPTAGWRREDDIVSLVSYSSCFWWWRWRFLGNDASQFIVVI